VVVPGRLVASHRDDAPLLEFVETAFDDVAALVADGIERDRPAPTLPAVRDLIVAFRDPVVGRPKQGSAASTSDVQDAFSAIWHPRGSVTLWRAPKGDLTDGGCWGMVLGMRVTVPTYDPQWPRDFERIKLDLEAALPGSNLLRIEHVGSTTVPGLADQARPLGSSMSGCSSKPTLSGELTSLAATRDFP
jgi:GrpB protein